MGKLCIIGAVTSLEELPYMVTVSHLFRGEGDSLIVDGMRLTVTRILKDYDLALIKLPPECMVKITELGSAAELEEAFLVNDIHIIRCRVISAGASLLHLGFRCLNMPEPEDSSSPIWQAGKVIGIISSLIVNNFMGIVISSSIISSLERWVGLRRMTRLRRMIGLRKNRS
ncbi:MAG TPA: serine protease [Methanosarcina sp.]|nr:serine protease [Methanosarcina sp.]